MQCRICGLIFDPEVGEDQESQQQEHWRIICGGLPYDIREFLKQAGHAAVNDKPRFGDERAKQRAELGKRAVAFAWWARAVANGIPENFFEPYMAAHLAYLDATVSGDHDEIENTAAPLKRWDKYG